MERPVPESHNRPGDTVADVHPEPNPQPGAVRPASPAADTGFHRAAILGLGLIGGSLVRALRQLGIDVVGYDPDVDTIAAAIADAVPVAASVAGAVHGADLIVLAMPLTNLPDALASIAPHVRDGAVVTDVGTLKAPVLRLVAEHLPRAMFVGGHPLAGTEESGWASSDADLFRDAPWALPIEHDTDLAAWLRIAELLCHLGSRPVPCLALEQDTAIARVIGLPHVLAETLALTGLDGGPLGLSLAAGSYRDGSRVARTRPELVATWCDGNAPLVTALDDVIARLTAARDGLAGGGSVYDLAAAAYHARIHWEQRRFLPVELPPERAALLAHGSAGGWITAVLRDEDGTRLLGMVPN